MANFIISVTSDEKLGRERERREQESSPNAEYSEAQKLIIYYYLISILVRVETEFLRG